MVTNDKERLISEKRNNKASAEGARLPKRAMLLRDIYKYIIVARYDAARYDAAIMRGSLLVQFEHSVMRCGRVVMYHKRNGFSSKY